MTPDKKSRRSGLIGAAIFGFCGVVLLYEAHQAQIHHTVIAPHRYGESWTTPFQGYVAAVMFLAVAAFAIVLALRAK